MGNMSSSNKLKKKEARRVVIHVFELPRCTQNQMAYSDLLVIECKQVLMTNDIL